MDRLNQQSRPVTKREFQLERRLSRLQRRLDEAKILDEAKTTEAVKSALRSAHGVPQAVVFLDLAGKIHVEIPSLNGTRRQIDLFTDLKTAAPDLYSALLDQRERFIRETYHTTRAERIDPQLAREQRIEAARLAHLREWQERFDNASAEEQQEMIVRRDKARAKIAEMEADRARAVYLMTATNHDVPLADRVIDDSKRRPNRRMKLSDNSYLVPRSGNTTDMNGKSPRKRKTIVGGEIVKITL